MARGCEAYHFLQNGWLAVAKPTPPMARRRDAQARGYDAELIKGGESCRGDAPKMSGVVSNHLFMRISPMSEGLFSWLRGISVSNYHHFAVLTIVVSIGCT